MDFFLWFLYRHSSAIMSWSATDVLFWNHWATFCGGSTQRSAPPPPKKKIMYLITANLSHTYRTDQPPPLDYRNDIWSKLSDVCTEWQFNFQSIQSHQTNQIPYIVTFWHSYLSLWTVIEQTMEMTKQKLKIEDHKTHIRNWESTIHYSIRPNENNHRCIIVLYGSI